MKRDQFEQQLLRLAEVYGAAKYPKHRADVLWDRFSAVSARDFQEAISNLIADESYAPMSTKIQMAIQNLNGKVKEAKPVNSFVKCRYCCDTGFILWSKKENPEQTCTTQCHRCPEGIENASGLKKANESMQEHWSFHFSVKNRFKRFGETG